MTIKSSGSLSLLEIDTEFGAGTNLAAYRGRRVFTDTSSTGTDLPSTSLGFNSFYSKRKHRPFPLVEYVSGDTVAVSPNKESFEVQAVFSMAFDGGAGAANSTYTDGPFFDGVATFNEGLSTNTAAGRRFMAMGFLQNIGSDTSETLSMSTSSGNVASYRSFRLVGGSAAYTRVSSTMTALQSYPRSYTYSLQKGDVVIGCGYHTTTSETIEPNFTISNMTRVPASTGPPGRIWTGYDIITSSGSYTYTMTSTNHNTHWINGIMVLRGTFT